MLYIIYIQYIIYNIYSEQQQTSVAAGGTRGSGSSLKRSIRSAKNIFIICSVYWLLYLPSLSFLFVNYTAPWQHFVTDWAYQCNPFVNNLLYVLLHRSVRQEVGKFFGRRRNLVVSTSTYQLQSLASRVTNVETYAE